MLCRTWIFCFTRRTKRNTNGKEKYCETKVGRGVRRKEPEHFTWANLGEHKQMQAFMANEFKYSLHLNHTVSLVVLYNLHNNTFSLYYTVKKKTSNLLFEREDERESSAYSISSIAGNLYIFINYRKYRISLSKISCKFRRFYQGLV